MVPHLGTTLIGLFMELSLPWMSTADFSSDSVSEQLQSQFFK